MPTPEEIAAPAQCPNRRAWLFPVIATVVVAAVLRLWATAGLSLVVTNDGTGYIQMAERFSRGEGMLVGVLRTPGYPAMLGVVVWLCGTSPVAVLLFHHALGCVSAGLTAFAGTHVAGRRTGLAVGILFAIDPWMLGLEGYLLTEAAAVTAMIAVVAMALCSRASSGSGWVCRGALLGVLLAAGCLIRPAMQSLVPFVGLAWLVRAVVASGGVRRGLGSGILAGAAVAAGFVVVSAPWLVHNARRDVRGFARGTELVPWIGFATNGLLDDTFALDEVMAREYATFKTLPVNDFSIWQFFDNTQMLSSPERLATLGAWCKASAIKNPGGYARASLLAAAWQLNIFPKSGTHHDNETRRYLRGVSVDATQWKAPAPNLHTAGVDPAVTRPLEMWGRGGPLRTFMTWFADKVPEGLHQVPLFAFGVFASVRALVRRDWGAALVFAGVMAFWGAHVAMLAPYSRYAMPAWGAWYIATAYSLSGRRTGASSTGLGRVPDLASESRPFRGVDGRIDTAAASDKVS